MIIFAEKPHTAKELRAIFPKSKILCTNSFQYKFDYLSFEKFSEPKYQLNKKEGSFLFMTYSDNGTSMSKEIDPFLEEYFLEPTEINYALDLDHAGVRAFDLLLKNVSNIANIDHLKIINLINMNSLAENDILRSYSDKNTFLTDKYIKSCREVYIKKDYIDYNIIGLTNTIFNTKITRNMLYLISNIYKEFSNKLINTSELTSFMAKFGIGSAASRTEIISKLLEYRFLHTDKNDLICLNSFSFFMIEKYPFLFNLEIHRNLQMIINNLEVSFEEAKPIFDNFLKEFK